jgi:formylglycine-generating enzyme required for sulfatase activity
MARDFERAAGWEKASGYYRKALGAGASGREEKEIRAAVARVEKRLKRQAEHLYRRARTALERGENRAAVILLDTYLGLQGSDASAGALRAQASQTPEGLRYLGINRHRHREYENMAAGYILVLLPGGESTMGGEKGSKDEKPAHRVVLPPHYMGKYPVTNAQYGRFLRWFSSAQGDHRHCHPAEPPGKDHVPAFQSDRRFSRAQHPVVGVDWFDAWAFASWAGLSLPSEAAWEAAAGAAGRNRFPWGDRLPDPDLCNFFDAHHGCTTPVDALRAGATASGLSDMAGNVLEWCLDWYNRKFYSRVGASGDNPCNTSETAKRVLRGGSWTSQADHCRCQKRGCDYPTARETHIGFRLVYGLPALPLVP